MPLKSYVIVFCLLMIAAGCRSNDTTSPASSNSSASSSPGTLTNPSTSPSADSATAVKSKVDVCNLLTSDDLKSVQGEAYKQAQRSDRLDGDFIVAQCYYQLPTPVNSVVLNVTTAKEGSGARSPRSFWEDTFGKDEGKGRESKDKASREKEKARAQKEKPKERGGEGENEEGPTPEKVNGLGDEAFWIASRVGGALYVLKKDQFFRISVGGAGDEKAKLSKSKALAQHVLKKF